MPHMTWHMIDTVWTFQRPLQREARTEAAQGPVNISPPNLPTPRACRHHRPADTARMNELLSELGHPFSSGEVNRAGAPTRFNRDGTADDPPRGTLRAGRGTGRRMSRRHAANTVGARAGEDRRDGC